MVLSEEIVESLKETPDNTIKAHCILLYGINQIGFDEQYLGRMWFSQK